MMSAKNTEREGNVYTHIYEMFDEYVFQEIITIMMMKKTF